MLSKYIRRAKHHQSLKTGASKTQIKLNLLLLSQVNASRTLEKDLTERTTMLRKFPQLNPKVKQRNFNLLAHSKTKKIKTKQENLSRRIRVKVKEDQVVDKKV